MKKYKANNRDAVIFCVKKIHRSSLPLCFRVIKEKTKQVYYICSMLCNAAIEDPPNFQPKYCGWVLKNSTFKINWLEGEISPSTFKIISPENEGDVSS